MAHSFLVRIIVLANSKGTSGQSKKERGRREKEEMNNFFLWEPFLLSLLGPWEPLCFAEMAIVAPENGRTAFSLSFFFLILKSLPSLPILQSAPFCTCNILSHHFNHWISCPVRESLVHAVLIKSPIKSQTSSSFWVFLWILHDGQLGFRNWQTLSGLSCVNLWCYRLNFHIHILKS